MEIEDELLNDPNLFRKYRPQLYAGNPPDTEKALKEMAALARLSYDAVKRIDGEFAISETARDLHTLHKFAVAAITELRAQLTARDAEQAARLEAARREGKVEGLREGFDVATEYMWAPAFARITLNSRIAALSAPPAVPAPDQQQPKTNWVNEVLDQAVRTREAMPAWTKRPELSAPPAAPGSPVCQFVDKSGKVCGGTNGGEGRHDWHHPFQPAPTPDSDGEA